MEKPLISLAIPVYNTSKYLKKCLESAIAQTYPNLEIVVLNNGSTDSSQKIIDDIAGKDERIKSFVIEHVPTIKESRDNCYRRTTGEWIIPFDSDDAISSDYIDKMWEAHLSSGADMVVSQRVSVDEGGKEYSYLPLDKFDFSTILSGKDAFKRTIIKWEMSVNGALVHKSNLYNIMLQNPNCKVFTDEYDSRVLLKNANKVAFCQARYYYTFNPNSVGKANNWNRHRFRLNTRIGLLELCEDTFGVQSKEYQAVVMQAIGINLIALKHYWLNKSKYTVDNYLELSSITSNVIESVKISERSCKNCFNSMLRTVLKVSYISIR